MHIHRLAPVTAVLALLLGAPALAAAPAPAKAASSAPEAKAGDTAGAPSSDEVAPDQLPEPPPRLDDPFVVELEGYKADAKARARTPDAALPLLRAYGLRDRLSTVVPLVKLYGTYAEWNVVPAEVRALSRYLLVQVQRSRGRMPSANEQIARLGFLNRFHVAGPFDNEGKAGCPVAYAPEKGIDLSARFEGKAREIGWRRLPELNRDGYVDLSNFLNPSDEAAAYALTILEVPADEKAVLHLGASGASRLWVNGTKVFADDTYHSPRFDQAHVGLTLRKGANRLLLKVCQSSGPNGFYLRVTNPNGEPIAGLASSAPDVLPAQARGAIQGETLPNLVDWFRKRAESAKDDARARAEYAEMLMHRQTFDRKDRRDAAEAAQAARLAPRDPSIRMLAGATAEDSNERREHLEAALAAQPLLPGATWALARHHLGRDYPRRALEILEPAIAKAPGYYPLAIQRIRAWEDLGMSARAALATEELARAFPDRPEVVREAARLARRRERSKDSIALLRVAIALRHDDLDSRRSLVAQLTDAGDLQGALKEQRELNELDQWDIFSWLRTGELAAANDLVEEARRAFARSRELAPDNAEVYEREGRALSRLGETTAAVAALQRSLELKPQNPQAKEALKALRPEGKGFGEDLAWDAPKLAAATAPTADEDAVVLGELTAIKVFPSGLSARFEQLVIRVQNARGVESERSQWVTYAPDRQDLKLLRARIIRPDGAIIESHTENERSLSDSGSKLYYDARGRVISFPNLAPGDVIELAYRLDDTANDNLLSDYFGDVQSLQSALPKANFDYYLSAPPGRTIYANTPTLPVARKEDAQPDGSRLYHWAARQVPKVAGEPGMPGRSEVAAYLHVSTYKDWDSVGRYYWGLVRDQLTPTEEIKAAYKEIVAKVPAGDELAIVRAVYGFVVSRTRYVGLEFGIHGYKPYKVDKVLARRFGDCKDKASLMHALLEAGGIDSRLVILRMRRLGTIDPNPASLAVFDHAILYVPKFDLWLDGTAELYGSRELPVQDRGAIVMVIEPNGGTKLGQIPEAKATDNLTRSDYEVALDATGRAVMKGKTVVSGQSAPEYRHTYQAPATRRQNYEQGWARAFPGLSVKALAFNDLTDIEKDIEITYEMEVPRFAQLEEGALAFSPFGQGTSYVESFAPLSARKHDLVIQYPWTNRFKHRYALPAAFTAKDLPADVDVKSPFGAVALKYRMDGTALVAEGEVQLGVSRVAAAQYPAFRAFLSQLDQALARKIRLGGAAAGPKTASAGE